MSQIQTLILAIGGLQGFLLFALLVSDRRVNYASKLLGFYCLLLTVNLLLPLIVVAGEAGAPWLIGYLVFLPAGFGALSYLYCRSAITGSPLNWADLIHLLPLMICYALNFNIMLSGEEALSFVRRPQSTTLAFRLTVLILYGQALFYAVLLMRMLHRYQVKAKQTLSSYNPNVFKWHWTLVAFMVSIWGLNVLSIWVPTINEVVQILLVIMIYFFAVAQWRNPSLFHVKQLEAELEQDNHKSSKPASNGLLDEDTRSSLLSLVQNQVKTQALYRNSELTLATLAEQVDVSVHHLSETLNQHGGKNFNRFINEYRVAEVCQQLEQNSERKLIDLALDAGFSSKSSFNAIFKKLTGHTPSLYRQQLATHL